MSVIRRFIFPGIATSIFLLFFVVDKALASSGAAGESHSIVMTLLWIAIILVVAKFSSLIEKLGQPSVLGELLAGVLLGNIWLLGWHFFEPIKSDPFIPFLAEIGVIILLFQVGLESNIQQMGKVGVRALLVAMLGVVIPFVLGAYLVGPWLFPGLGSNTYLFLGAALTATSVGITARVFKDLGKLKTSEAQIVLGAAVIDDVVGLVILAVVSAIVTLGAISLGGVALIIGKAVGFLVGAIVLGQLIAPRLGKLFSLINTGVGMKFTLAISLALLFSFGAGKIGLAPIVGAFAAGLVLDPVHFTYFKKPKVIEELDEHVGHSEGQTKEMLMKVSHEYTHRHVDDLIEPLAHFFVPIFFVATGMSVRLETLFNPTVLVTALGITVVAVAGKLVSGLVAGKVDKLIVGFGMVPRGEVGLIFATIGKSLGVIPDEVFSVIVIMVIFTTLLTPPVLNWLLKRQAKSSIGNLAEVKIKI